jgi:cyclic beta-1,2-glucan synthetase
MTLVALANALLGDPMVNRFHADPRVQATEAAAGACAAPLGDHSAEAIDEMRALHAGHAAAALPLAAHGVSAPQFLSNGNYVTNVTNAGGGSASTAASR